MKKPDNHGSVVPLRNGRFWVRGPLQPNGKRPSFGTFATREEAEIRRNAGCALLIGPRDNSPSFAVFGEEVLNLREEEGVRGIAQERGRFRVHLATSSIAEIPITQITAPNIAELARTLMRKRADDKRGDRKISRKTVQRVLSLTSAIFTEAIARGIVAVNPTTGVKVRKRADEGTEEAWDYLTMAEQRALVTCGTIPEADRMLMQFAIGTGLRQGEQWNLELRDLHITGPEPHVFVRFGSKGKAPKSGRTRTVPLFGLALAAAKRWLELLPSYADENPHGLVFPTQMGCRRGIGAPEKSERAIDAKGNVIGYRKIDLFHRWLQIAGINRRLRWHDLRHTCASSLVGGFWGDPWSLEEVREMLGHSSITVTQMYAHLGETSLKRAARKVIGDPLVTTNIPCDAAAE